MGKNAYNRQEAVGFNAAIAILPVLVIEMLLQPWLYTAATS